MSHEIEQFSDGTAAYAGRLDAWHQLGTSFGQAMTAEQALDAAKLSRWNVRKIALQTVDGLAVPGQYATVRDNPVERVGKGKAIRPRQDVLGIVGEAYVPIQNEEHCQILQALCDESGAMFETAGSLRDGRETFVSMRLPDSMLIGGKDRLDLYIAALNSHDGHSNFELLVTPVRVVCANTQAAALANNESRYTFRHTSGAKLAIAEARSALDLTFGYLTEFQAAADAMINTELTVAEFRQVCAGILDANPDLEHADKPGARWAKIDTLTEIFQASETLSDVRGTAWAGYQTITEWLDHLVELPGSEGAALAERRALRTLTSGDVADLKFDAFAEFAPAGAC